MNERTRATDIAAARSSVAGRTLFVVFALLFGLSAASTVQAQHLAVWHMGGAAGVSSGDNGTVAVSVGETNTGATMGSNGSMFTGFWDIATGLNAFSSIDSEPALPLQWEIGNAYPNPFNPSTTVSVSIPLASRIHVAVYNVLGQRVAVLEDGVFMAGIHRFVWNANGLASGVYFLRVEAPGHMQKMQKVVLVR
jgi:hypothetical protein